MINNFLVMSQRDAKKYCADIHTEKSIIISINNSFEMPIKLTTTSSNQVKDVLSLSFDDVVKTELVRDTNNPYIWLTKYGSAVSPIGDDECRKIYEFVNKYHKDKDKYILIVHCEMGVSRSAAVAAAIMKYITGNDMPIYKDGRYRPNPDVYRDVYNELFNHKAEDKMSVSKDNLRFGIKHTPIHYHPIFDPIMTEHKVNFVPNVEMCDLMPELENVAQPQLIKGTGLPFIAFNFAILMEDSVNNKIIFNGGFEIDKNLFEARKDDNPSYKDSVSYQLMDLYDKRSFPGIFTKRRTKVLDGVVYDTTYYYITLYNVNSPYYYQEFKPYHKKKSDYQESLIEVEYTFPSNLKTWVYFRVKKTEVKHIIDIGETNCNALNIIFDSAKYELFFMGNDFNRSENNSLNFDGQFYFVQVNSKDNLLKRYNINCVESTGEEFIISFSEEEWVEEYMPNFITGFRVIKM